MKHFIITVAALLTTLAATAAEEPMVLRTAGCELQGTLLAPDNASRTVALIIAGSGPTDRNGNNNMGMKTEAYHLLADSLAAHGYASLRYDKRGIAASATPDITEEQLTFEAYIEDAVAWAEQLAADPRFDRVVLLGHSEGALIALAAAKRTDAVCGVATLAGPGEPLDATLRRQLAQQPEAIRKECCAILDTLKSGRMAAQPSPALYALFRPSVQPYLISQLKYDPAEEARTLTKPLLIIQGTTDIQIPVDNADRLAAAAPDARKVIIEGMNHVLKCCESTSTQAQMFVYINDTIALAPGLTETLAGFLGSF